MPYNRGCSNVVRSSFLASEASDSTSGSTVWLHELNLALSYHPPFVDLS